ncbi:hypothetical protein C8E83_1969 [Frondihabitans australicus]|uniref:Uncharacterized protein n=2 Tax=Frondihabitans australicus TaxID=386892 RepID=A0A495IHB9_9MICO|nr:hypothetical protein C8E83_1969 [Frondihabitans australicus]
MRSVGTMSDDSTHDGQPDGSTNLSEADKEYTENLDDGSTTGDAGDTDTDYVSGGEPDEPEE